VDLRPLGVGPRPTRFRLLTTMCIHWDEVRFGRAVPDRERAIASLLPLSATLAWRGFSREIGADADGPARYDYQHVSRLSPWKQMVGTYTATGPVDRLLARADDRFVVARTGDEVALAFDAVAAGAPPAGWTRTYVLEAQGYSKEMDVHSVSPDRVGPLPFRAMRHYPPAPEDRPANPDPDQPDQRVVTRAIPRLESLLVPED
jgi:hypothetical protein